MNTAVFMDSLGVMSTAPELILSQTSMAAFNCSRRALRVAEQPAVCILSRVGLLRYRAV